jgi:hypothetical protein
MTEPADDTGPFFYAVELCRPLGIPEALLGNALLSLDRTGVAAAIDELACAMLAWLEVPGEKGEKDRPLVDYLCKQMVWQCCKIGIPPSVNLAVLVGRQLPAADSFSLRAHKKPLAYSRAAEYCSRCPNASNRQIAKYAGVDHHIVAEWLLTAEFQDLLELFQNVQGFKAPL